MNDDDVRRLFESLETRGEPPAEVRNQVRGAVHSAWEDMPSVRRRRPAATYGAVAGVVVVAASAWLVWTPRLADTPSLAGELAYATGGHRVIGSGDVDAPRLASGATVETSHAGRVLIRMESGALIRLDVDSRLALRSPAEVSISAGRMFADSKGADVAVTTPSGVQVENVGTQFEVAVFEERVVVAVRQGRIDVRTGGQAIRSEALEGTGESVALEGTDVVAKETVTATDPRWDWIHASMPAFEMDGATVFEFLTWAAAETGVALEFANEGVANHARLVRLHGPPVPAERVGHAMIRATLQTVPSLWIQESKGGRLVVGWSSRASVETSDE